MNLPQDNVYKECPAVMNYSIGTDYRSSTRREEHTKYINGIEA